MLLTLTTTMQPASDLGYLLGKHPQRLQTFSLAFGQAHVFYPEVGEERCTAALLLDINPIGLVRSNASFALAQYVNDRPYVASSFLSVAIAQVFRSALNGTCKERPALVMTPIPLEATIAALPNPHGESLLRDLFEPLGYTIEMQTHPLDEQFPQWGASHYVTLTLRQTIPLHLLLAHLYVLIPVLDNEKHYYVGDDEVEKLLAKGGDWLKSHPARRTIARRYLKYNPNLVKNAMEQLTDESAPPLEDESEAKLEKSLSLHDQRLSSVLEVLKASGAAKVLDLGCGEGRLLKFLLKETQFKQIVGMDVSLVALQEAAQKLRWAKLSERQRQRLQLIQGSLFYRDKRLVGFDAAALVEVIEHFDPSRLPAFEHALFQFAHPHTVLVTTPNAEYNSQWPSLSAGKFRHKDHRFEWTRAQFEGWAERIAKQFGYQVRFMPIGPLHESLGAPSQMAIFEVLA